MELQLDSQTDLQVADKQPIVQVGLQGMEEAGEVDIGLEIKLPVVPDGANLIEVQEVEEMVTEAPAVDSALSPSDRDTTKAGYDCRFLDPDVASEYNCSICLSVSREPQQTKCCGSTFCLYCIQQALASSKGPSCPNCNSESVELIPDKAQRQKINKLKVQCPIEGCLCVVELADIEAHKKVPHPVTPPTSNLHREQRQQYYNTLPIPLHKKQQVESEKAAESGEKRPIPTPRVLASKSPENIEHDVAHTSLSQPDQEVPGSEDQNEVSEHLNLTMRRPQMSRKRPESSPPDPKRQRGAQCVEIEALAPLQSQAEQPLDQFVPLQDDAQPPTNQMTSNQIYENVVVTPNLHRQEDQNVHEVEPETESASHVPQTEFTVVLKPRVSRDRSSSQSPPVEQDETQSSRQSSLPPPELPQSPVKLQHKVHTSDLTPHGSSSITPQPDYEAVASPALDKFGMTDFQATPDEANSPRPVEHNSGTLNDPSSPEVPMEPQMVDYVNVGPQLPLLPDDLLALLDNPTTSSQPQGVSTNVGLPLSPLASPQLETQLLTLPEQLLNMIQPVPEETPEEDEAPLLSPAEGPEYVNTAPIHESEESYVEISPFHEGSQSEQSDYVEVTSPPQEEETQFEYTPMSPFHGDIQPDYVEVPHQMNEAEEPAADYVPMSPPPRTSQTYYVEVEPVRQSEPNSSVPTSPLRPRVTSEESEYEVPLLQDMDQQEYEDIPSRTQATAAAEAIEAPVARLPPPPPPEVVVALPQAQAPEEKNYETIPAAVQEADDTEHIYEPLPQPRPLPTPEEPDQAVYADVPDPLPPRSQSEPPEPHTNQEPVPPVPPRPASQAIEPTGITPADQNQNQDVSVVPAPTAEQNYETIPAAVQEADDTEHIYEPLPQPRPLPIPEEPDQAVYADVPDPLPPTLPPRSQSEPPEPQANQEPVPPVPPRPASQAIEPTGITPADQNQNQDVSVVPAPTADAAPPQPPQTEPTIQTGDDGVAVLSRILQNLQQGNAAVLTESLPPQYDDLSQAPRYTDLVQGPAVQQNQPPHAQAFIIQNANTDTVARQGPIRAENVNIQYEMGDRQQHRNKNIYKTQTLL